MIAYPESFVARWHQAHKHDSLLEWRSLAFWVSAEANLAAAYDQHHTASELLTLFEIAMQHVYRLSAPQKNA